MYALHLFSFPQQTSIWYELTMHILAILCYFDACPGWKEAQPGSFQVRIPGQHVLTVGARAQFWWIR